MAEGLAPALRRHTDLVLRANRTPREGEESLAPLAEVAAVEADIIIISVADKAIDEMVSAISPDGTLLPGSPLCVLTSGSIGMEHLKPLSDRTGVLYPLQTFTKGFDPEIEKVPFFTEASRCEDLELIDSLVRAMGAGYYHADDAARRTLHLSGVFTNNFVNVLLEETQNILAAKGYPLETVRPLLEMTVRKAFALGPHAAQTGPARRGDLRVMDFQRSCLPERLRPAFDELNKLICQSHHTLTHEQDRL